MVLAHERDIIEWHLSQIVYTKNEFLPQFTYLQSHFYVKYKGWKYKFIKYQ